MKLTPDQAVKAADGAASLLSKYTGTEVHKVLIELMDSLEMCHLYALADVSPEGLAQRQGALRQVRQLRDAAMHGATART